MKVTVGFGTFPLPILYLPSSTCQLNKKALDNRLTPSAQELVLRQFAEIKVAHDRIKSLRDAAKELTANDSMSQPSQVNQ
jgi:hypothetical protein